MTVVGAGEVEGTPDTLTINAAMEIIAPDAAGAMDQTSQRQQAVIDALVAMGIDRKDINTTQVSVQPQYTGGESTNIIGYRASNSIDIKIRQLDAASQAFAAIVSTGGDATRINNVTLAIEDDSQLVREARARAFNDAKSRAEQYALLSGLDLGKVVSISEAPATPPPIPYPTGRPGDGHCADRARPADRRVQRDGGLRAHLIQPAGAISTGMPLSTAVPDSGSRWLPSLSWLTFTPGWAAATVCPVPPRS